MKNFRKVLALVLVVATLFSFVAMTASAKEYTDADKVSYTEAVDVLTAIGILNGYTDGTYRPTNTIARAEMAKMIAVLANEGKDNIGDLYASACKFADMTGDAVWAKSYVAYCNQIGIVAGRNATTFDPYGKVTGVETAKMLLCMIGFDAKAQGYVGTNWQVNVMRDAEKVGLLEGLAADYKIEKAITREESAQMMLNALLAPMVVGTVSGNIVNITNTVWLGLNDLKLTIKTITLTDAIDVYDCYILYDNVLVSNVPVWTNYAGLKVNDNDRDCYGNPVTTWSYTNEYGKETWTESYAHAYDYYYTDVANIEADLDKLGDNVNINKSELWIDGKEQTVTSLDDLIDDAEAASGRGVEVKVYIQTYININDNTHVASIRNRLIITVKNTFIGEVVSVNKAAGTFTLNDVPYASAPQTFDNGDYGFKEDDIVLYWLCDHDFDAANDYDLHDAKVATPVNVDLTRIFVGADSYDNYIVGSNKTYNYAENFGNETDNSSLQAYWLNDFENRDSGTYDLYLDEFGYIMAWKHVDDSVETGYVYLQEGTGIYTVNGYTSSGDILYTATATTVDFTAKDTATDPIDEDAFLALEDYEDDYDHGVLIRYIMKDGRKTLDDEGTADGGIATLVDDNGVVLNKNGNLYDADGDLYAVGDEDTKYLVRTYDYSTGDFKYAAYDWKSLPYNFVGALNSVEDADKGDTVVANIQYFAAENEVKQDVLTYVFVNALYTDSTPVNAFVIDLFGYTNDDLFNTVLKGYVGYNAVIAGKDAILAVNPSLNDDIKAGYWLNQADLMVIGLTDNDVPVYASANKLKPDTRFGKNNAWYYTGGKIWLYDGDGTKEGSYFVGDSFFAVVAYEKADGSYDHVIITDPAKINDYVEMDNGKVTVEMPEGYSDVRSWGITDGETINELYIVVKLNPEA